MSTSPETNGGPGTLDEPTATHRLRLGAVGGVPVYLSTSWFIITAAVVLVFGPDVDRVLPGIGAATAYLVALAYALLLAISVLCHEAAHALAAGRCGYNVEQIVVNLWGGHTTYTTAQPSPRGSALVAISGPAANALLAAGGWALLPLLPPGIPLLLGYAWTFSNAFVALFNMLPGLPLDGGFLVDAAIWRYTGRRSAGLITAGWAGRAVTALAVLWLVARPLISGEDVNLWNVAWLAFIGAFLWAGASSSIVTGKALAAAERVALTDVVRPVALVGMGEPAAAVPERVGASPGGYAVPVLLGTDGTPAGLVDPEAFSRLSPEETATVPAGALLLAQPAGWLARYDADQNGRVAAFLPALVSSPYGVIVLQDANGRCVGVLTSGDVEQAVSEPAENGT
ncbi:M50 family metallopeptidase [Austwickia chelonae]|uniref:M50 family metallopeptidase n=1 Tax=Austwickia chelonae TaxID=100225 RepID=UPI0013C321D3|nr:M50 family metallopeptidase [Austwickia chelonae]